MNFFPGFIAMIGVLFLGWFFRKPVEKGQMLIEKFARKMTGSKKESKTT
jgi:hypothetical protein